jgi:predicted permease
MFLARRLPVVLAHLRYSARSLTRTPALALTLVLTIALGIGSNAAVHGFMRGLIAHAPPISGIESVVSVFALDEQPAPAAVSYDTYLSLKNSSDTFAWLGAARELHSPISLADRTVVMIVAAVTPELAQLLDLPLHAGAVIGHRVWQNEFGAKADLRDERVRIAGVDTGVAGVAPDWLEGLYAGRPVDMWIPLTDDALQSLDHHVRNLWVLGRLRQGGTAERAQAAINAPRAGGVAIGVRPYDGMTPEMAGGLRRIGTLLRLAAAAVFAIACANVASLLMSRASARSRESSVRVALGASRRQLVSQLLADSVLISLAGGGVGVVLARWTSDVAPALFFEEDAAHLLFAPDPGSILSMSAVCVGITIGCGLMPLLETRHDNPAAVLQRESSGPSKATQRLRAMLVVAQITCCCALVICTGLLLDGVRASLQTSTGHRLGQPILASVQGQPAAGRFETAARGLEFFHNVEAAAEAVPGISAKAWVAALPGGLPSWQALRIEPPGVPVRDVTMDVAAFTPEALALVTMPPLSGRLFGGQDTAATCRVGIVNQEAAADLFDGDAVGRSIEDRTGERVEIIGVVHARKPEPVKQRARPAIYYYPAQSPVALDRIGPASFRVPARQRPAAAAFDTNVVSASYFATMGWPAIAGEIFTDVPARRGCRVAVVNTEAADLYFGGNAVGSAVIDDAGRRTEIIGVVRAAPLLTLQRRVEPAIYFPMSQDFLLRMTLILSAPRATDATVAAVHRALDAVPGRGPAPVAVRTLDAHMSRTALAPLRIATTLVGASAAIALSIGVLGLYGAMSDAARQRRRETALRIALGAQRWRVIGQVLADGARLTAAGIVAGAFGSLLAVRSLARIVPEAGSSVSIWLTAPVLLIGAVAIASVLPARRALRVDPLTIMNDD